MTDNRPHTEILIVPPGELHPEPLTDSDVNLSIHPALATS